MRERLLEHLRSALRGLLDACDDAGDLPEFALEVSRSPEHGDFACNAAMVLAKRLRKPPRALAERIAAAIAAMLLLTASGCNSGEGQREFISVGTAPIGGVFYTVGSAVSDVVNEADEAINVYGASVNTNSWSYGVEEGRCDEYGDYDFLAPEAERGEAQQRVMRAGKPRSGESSPSSALLRTSSGEFDQAAFDRLSAMRNDQEMDLRE